MDPTCLIVKQRIVQMRRAVERKPELKKTIDEILHIYEGREEPGTQRQEENEGDIQPAPHPNTGSRTAYLRQNNPMGPVGLVVQAVNMLGAVSVKNMKSYYIMRHLCRSWIHPSSV